MHTTIAEFNAHDEAKQITNGLITCLEGWSLSHGVTGHLWILDGWTVASHSLRSHVVILAPDGRRRPMDHAETSEVISTLRAMGAPLEAHDDAEMRLVNELTAGWVLS